MVESSIVCGGVVLRKGVRVERGSLLSFGVVVGQGVTVPPFSRICRPHPDAASTVRIRGGGGAVGSGEGRVALGISIHEEQQQCGHVWSSEE